MKMSMFSSSDSVNFPQSVCTVSGNFASTASSIADHGALAVHLPKRIRFLRSIRKFRSLKRNEPFTLEPSWSGMNIYPVGKDRLDSEILAKRVTLVFENTILQTRLMASVPRFLEDNGKLLREWMTPEDAHFVISRLTNWNTHRRGARQIRTITGFVIENDIQMAFRKIVTNNCAPLYVEKYPPEMTAYVRTFTQALTDFSNLIHRRMEMTAGEADAREKHLRRVHELMRERRVDLKRYKDMLDEHIGEHEERLQSKDEIIDEVSEKYAYEMAFNLEQMEECLRESDRVLYEAGEKSTALTADLLDQSKMYQVELATLRDKHIIEERTFRAQKFKLESQLSMWLAKYDGDIGERQAELEAVTEAYEIETRDMQELECLMLEQEKIYLRYVHEKEEEDLDKVKAKLFVIASVRAAKILQRAWREYIKRKKAKRKAKKKRGKK